MFTGTNLENEHFFGILSRDKSNTLFYQTNGNNSSIFPRLLGVQMSLSHHQLLLFDLTLKTLAVAFSQYTYPEKQASIMSAKRDMWVASVYRWHLLLLWRLRWIAVCDQAQTTGSSYLPKGSLMAIRPSTLIHIFKLFRKATISMLLNSLTAKSVSIKPLL